MADEAPYHHGDLPAALLAAVDDLVREGGVGAVSLREAARRVGVSHAAPAHHFGDKAGLLTAFATEGFRLLRDHLGGAVPADDEADEGFDFTEVGLAYVHFAVSHPAHFAVMFRPEHLHGDDAAYRQAAVESFMVVVGAVRRLRPDLEDDHREQLAAATGAWSLAHGFATLWLEGNLGQLVDTDDARKAARAAFEAFGATLLPHGRSASGVPVRPAPSSGGAG